MTSDANPKTPTPIPLALVRRPAAAAMCGLGLSTFDRYDAAGLVPPARRVGGAKVWSVAELKAWAEHGCPDRAAWTPVWKTILAARRAAAE